MALILPKPATLAAKKNVDSLQLQSQLKVLQICHEKCEKLEIEYLNEFCKKLSAQQQRMEMDINLMNADWNQIVDKYEVKNAKKSMKGRVKSVAKKVMPKREGLRPKPYPAEKPSDTFMNFIKNIRAEKRKSQPYPPPGVTVNEFLTYKKAKFLLQINQIRDFLRVSLNIKVLNGLEATLENIMYFAVNCDSGYLTLQSVLTTPETICLDMTPLKLCKNMMSRKFSGSLMEPMFYPNKKPEYLDSRIETTLIMSGLKSSYLLTHLRMSGSACDNFLKCVSQNCVNLKSIDFSESFVSDFGFYYLCGLTETEKRASRACKRSAHAKVKTLVKTQPGCVKLTHLVANNLKSVNWNIRRYLEIGHSAEYTSYTVLPPDCGFVMALKHLPKLQVFMTQVGGRAIGAFKKQSGKKSLRLPALEVISEINMSKESMKVVMTTCPNLKSIMCKASKPSTGNGGMDESWMELLTPKLREVHIMEASFKGPNLVKYLLESTGSNLTTLDIRELNTVRLSWFRKIKINCQNLQRFIFGITTRHLSNLINPIDVINDFNLGNGEGKEDLDLKHLEQLHLAGPFGAEIAKYLIKGAEHLHDLALLITWPHGGIISVQPSNNKDYLGVEYLQELLKSNPLQNLTQLHLFTRDTRSKKFLDKNCAEFLLRHFVSLKHFGTLKHWKLTRSERSEIVSQAVKQNRNITFDEDLKANKNTENAEIRKRYVTERHCAACHDPRSMVTSTYLDHKNALMMDFFGVLAGLHGFFGENPAGDDSDSSSDEDEDMEDLEAGDLDEDEEDEDLINPAFPGFEFEF